MLIDFTYKAIFVIVLTLSYIDSGTAQNGTTWFPKYHIRPEKGWINDPNGLVYHQGYYHVFWQYTPDSAVSGLKYWGHARSTDLLTWEYLPIALSPSLPEDIDGIWSGSAVVKDDNIAIIYTGVSENSTRQRQMAAVSANGIFFEKLGVIIDRDGDEHDFRDPKAWQQGNSWFVVTGARTPSEGRGEALLYKSPDFVHWNYEGPLAEADDKLGFMWECPDFYTLRDKQILAFSPPGIQPDGYDFLNPGVTGYFVGSWTPGGNYTIEKGFREIDHGHDFYASQTFLAPDERRILIAWIGASSSYPEQTSGWAGMLTLPRELTLSDSGDLEVRPIREIKHVRVERFLGTGMLLSEGEIFLPSIGGIYNSEILVKFNLTETFTDGYGIALSSDFVSNEGIHIYVDYSESRLFLVRNYPQYGIEESTRSVPLDLTLPELSLDLFIDSSSIELFVNDGQAVMTSRIYPNDDQRIFYFFSGGGTLSISEYSIWDI